MSNLFGGIFAEEIIKGQRRKVLRTGVKGHERDTTGRIFFLIFLLVFGLGVIAAKLFTVNIIEGNKYFKLASENRIRETKIAALRGIIYDRNGKALVRNIPTFTLPTGQIFYETKPATVSGKYKESATRNYINNEATAHVLGFVGEVSGEELKTKNQEPRTENLELGDLIGKMGIEKAYDNLLRGANGRELKEVDAQENEVRTLGNKEEVAGKNLNLTLDIDLLEIAKSELTDKKGAVIASDPNTGEILALYSSPSFDPNKLVRSEDIDILLSDPDKPFFNRVISGLYPPGSTFKIVTALAALESGAINKDTEFEDIGILQIGPFSFGNWYFLQYGKKEGMVDIVKGIKRSNDIFFYKTGEAVGIDTLATWGKKVGLGNTLGIDIEGEAEGVMPDPVWRKKARGDDWFLGDTYHVAIGQGDLQVTPLQVNAWTNVIASGGRLCRPHLNQEPRTKNLEQEYCKDLGIKKEAIDLIREGMRQACSPGGTGWPLFEFRVQNSELRIDNLNFFPTYESTTSGKPWVKIPVACKTGTAEFNDPNNRTHAWFTVFTPVSDPQISVTVLVEAGGEGSNVAAPIAKKILEKWFSQ